MAALKAAKGGDIITLAPGTYDGLSFDTLNFSPAVTITSADTAHPGKLMHFVMENVSGLTFRNVVFSAEAPTSPAYNIYNGQNITLDHVNVHGSLDGNPQNDPFGISFFDSNNITVSNSVFQQLSSGLGFTRSSNIVVSGNHIHDMESDALDFNQMSNLRVTGNVIHDIFPVPGDHPDNMQFMTAGTSVASHDITVSGNLMYKGAGAYAQGIFMGDEVGTLPFQNVTLSDNLIVGTGWSAIRPTHNIDLTIIGNTLITLAGDQITNILVQYSDRVTASNNSSADISFSNTTTNINESNDTSNVPAVSDTGAAAIQQWLASHAAVAAIYNGSLAVAPSKPRSQLAAALSAYSTFVQRFLAALYDSLFKR